MLFRAAAPERAFGPILPEHRDAALRTPPRYQLGTCCPKVVDWLRWIQHMARENPDPASLDEAKLREDPYMCAQVCAYFERNEASIAAALSPAQWAQSLGHVVVTFLRGKIAITCESFSSL